MRRSVYTLAEPSQPFGPSHKSSAAGRRHCDGQPPEPAAPRTPHRDGDAVRRPIFPSLLSKAVAEPRGRRPRCSARSLSSSLQAGVDARSPAGRVALIAAAAGADLAAPSPARGRGHGGGPQGMARRAEARPASCPP